MSTNNPNQPITTNRDITYHCLEFEIYRNSDNVNFYCLACILPR